MGKPIIGITSNEKPVAEGIPIMNLSLSRNFADGIKRAGGLPFYIPLSGETDVVDYVSAIDKLLLTGGQHVLPQFYGQEKLIESDDYFKERDEFELKLVHEALRQEKPILGICRGMQLFNVARGGTLKQAVEGHRSLPFDLIHQVECKEATSLASIFGQRVAVNSIHSQAIENLGQGLEAIVHSVDDGIIEAVRSMDETRFLGVQWHPELLIDQSGGNQKLFDYFVQTL
ncbi:gamma-glutamyl-gamma-aminobutyrate hydrolase family protein [Streptococcus suis]|nr:gamma-glutamyl-gamma-aminobutyrate hydrolase family protein [Streptococcus suis]